MQIRANQYQSVQSIRQSCSILLKFTQDTQFTAVNIGVNYIIIWWTWRSYLISEDILSTFGA